MVLRRSSRNNRSLSRSTRVLNTLIHAKCNASHIPGNRHSRQRAPVGVPAPTPVGLRDEDVASWGSKRYSKLCSDTSLNGAAKLYKEVWANSLILTQGREVPGRGQLRRVYILGLNRVPDGLPLVAEVNVFPQTLDRGFLGDYGTGFTDFGT